MAGVEPWPYTLKELHWMARACELAAWDRTAWLCLHMPRMGRRRRYFEDFHPMRTSKRRAADMLGVMALARQAAKTLPEKLTEEEIMTRWEAYKAKRGRRRRM